MNRSIRNLMILGLLATMAGCSTAQRPATAIRQDADWHFQRGEYDQAVVYYREVVARYPGDWDAQYHYGTCELKLGRAAEARRALEIAHSRKPEHVGVVDALAEAMYQVGDDNRLFAFLRERADSTQTVHAYLRQARYAIELGDPDSARKAIETAIMIDNGESVEPYLIAALFAERIGDIEQAVKRLRQAYGINPTDDSVKTRLRALGEIPGPTLALPPGV
jgi:tetratricopeptide (TPR) repeat protein